MKVSISKLVLDYNLYPRTQVDAYKVNEICEAMRANITMPPIIVEKKTMRVVDGFHRITAVRKLYGPNAKIEIILKEYASEVAVFCEAMSTNSSHGRGLDKYDKLHSAQIAVTLGMSRDSIACALNLTRQTLDGLLDERVSLEGEPLKLTMRHFSGKSMTEEQIAFNRGPAGGMAPLFYVNQIVGLLETNSINWDNERLVARLKYLVELLDKQLGVKV